MSKIDLRQRLNHSLVANTNQPTAAAPSTAAAEPGSPPVPAQPATTHGMLRPHAQPRNDTKHAGAPRSGPPASRAQRPRRRS